MFVGRSDELQVLEKLYAKETFQFVVIYGRRRVGKTTLIGQFIQNKDAIFFSAQEANDHMNLDLFTQQVYAFFNVPKTMGGFRNWDDAFSYIALQAKTRRFILAIDEFPYAAQANKGLKSILQNIIDHQLKDSGLFLILCGSQISFMENEVLGYKSPLFGRRTSQMKIEGFDYLDAARLMKGFNNEDKIKLYSSVGGTPHYLAQIDCALTFEENIKDLYFNTSGYLYDEPLMLLAQELREPAMYNSVISAIAGGASKLNDIATKIGEDSKKTMKYVTSLLNLRIIHKEYPFGDNPAKSRKAVYRISDNCYNFWYRYVFLNRGAIEKGTGAAVADRLVFPTISEFIGKPAFEEICHQYIVRLNQSNRLPFLATGFGCWWGTDDRKRQQSDIDIVVHSKAGEDVLLGECKWRNELDDVSEIKKLMDKAHLLSGYRNYSFYLFSKFAFSAAAKQFEAQTPNLSLISLDMLFEE